MARSKREKTRFDEFQKDFKRFYIENAVEKMDKRLPFPRTYCDRKDALVVHLGGHERASVVEVIEAGNATFHSMMVESLQRRIVELSQEGGWEAVPQKLVAQYQTFANLWGKNADRLGLSPRITEKPIDLQQYLKDRET